MAAATAEEALDQDDVVDIARTVKSVADAVGPPLATISKFAEALALPAAQEIGRAMVDEVRAWRVRRQLATLEDVRRKLEEREAAGTAAPIEFLAEALSGAGRCDDEDLRALWAELIAQGVVEEEARHPMFRDTLAKLSPTDAKAFASIAASAGASSIRAHMQVGKTASAVDRLLALGLLERFTPRPLNPDAAPTTVALDHDRYDVSDYGAQFAKAVGVRVRSNRLRRRGLRSDS